MLTGQNGILNKAQEAKEKTEIANQDESDKLSSMEAMVQTTGKSIPNPSSYGENPNAQATADGTGKYFALPNGAKYLEGTVDTGIVVEIKGSEFVWVPVDDVVLDTSRTSELPTGADNGTTNGKTYTPMAVKVDSDYKGLLYEFNENNSYLKYSNNKNYQGASFQNREPDILSTYDGTDLDITEEKITVEIENITDETLEKIKDFKTVEEVTLNKNILLVTYKKGNNNLRKLIDFLEENKVTYNKIFSERPTLNDVFLELTGKELRD